MSEKSDLIHRMKSENRSNVLCDERIDVWRHWTNEDTHVTCPKCLQLMKAVES